MGGAGAGPGGTGMDHDGASMGMGGGGNRAPPLADEEMGDLISSKRRRRKAGCLPALRSQIQSWRGFSS